MQDETHITDVARKLEALGELNVRLTRGLATHRAWVASIGGA